MSAITQQDLLDHAGHSLSIYSYGKGDDSHSTTIECDDCSTVLMSIEDDVRSIHWSIDDFLNYEMSSEWIITEEQAREALKDMIDHHDASIGITWDTVEYYYQKYGTNTEEDEE